MPDPRALQGKLTAREVSDLMRGDPALIKNYNDHRTDGTLGEHVDWKIAYVEQEIRQHKDWTAKLEGDLKALWVTKEKLRKLGLHDITASHLPNIPL